MLDILFIIFTLTFLVLSRIINYNILYNQGLLESIDHTYLNLIAIILFIFSFFGCVFLKGLIIIKDIFWALWIISLMDWIILYLRRNKFYNRFTKRFFSKVVSLHMLTLAILLFI